jgi:hypothetical protein
MKNLATSLLIACGILSAQTTAYRRVQSVLSDYIIGTAIGIPVAVK